MTAARNLVLVIVLVVGLLAIVVGVLYLVEAASSLPSFFPGHVKVGTGHLPKHGYAALALGVVLAVGAAIGLGRGGRRSGSRSNY